jgi:lipoprotein-anchoring transpeptidase ErfK/SrfK
MRELAFLSFLFLFFAVAPVIADPWDGMRTAKPAGQSDILLPRDILPAANRDRAHERAATKSANTIGVQPLAYGEDSNLGSSFIEFLFTGRSGNNRGRELPRPTYMSPWQTIESRTHEEHPDRPVQARLVEPDVREGTQPAFNPRFERSVVYYPTQEKPGTVVIDTGARFLYYVEASGKATRYGVGVGRPGFEWAGAKQVTQKREWPDWIPPKEMLERRPELPTFMAGGPDNPLGARAIYLGSSLYRIHGSNEPHTIGQAVSSGCFRMRNQDVIEIYERMKVGTRVVVI